MTNRIALITGAGSGIGRAVSTALHKDGFQVVLAGRNATNLEQTAAEAGGGTVAQLDVRNVVEVTALFEKIEKDFGHLDLLFNNAGVFGQGSPVDEISEESWRNVVETNLNGAFWCAQAAFKLMKNQIPQGGRIINNGSISAHVPRPYATAYTTTKHAMTGLTKALSLEGRSYNIACGQIDIGNAATAITEKMTTGTPQASGELAIEPTMNVAHVAETIRQIANLPTEVNVPFMTIMANKMPYIGRG